MQSHQLRGLASILSSLFAAGVLAAQDPIIPADTDLKTTDSGLMYSVLEAGEGERPSGADMVTVHYTGWLTNGTMFDSSRQRGAPAEFPLNAVIPGWTEGLQLMSVGSRFKLTIPYDLAYGEAGRPPTIPAKSTLIFDVELLGFRSAPKFPKADPSAQTKTKSGLTCQVMNEGGDEALAEGEDFELEFAMFSPTGELLDGTFASKILLTRRHAERMPFLAEVAQTMKVGSVVRVEVSLKDCFPQGIPPQLAEIGEGGMLVWQLELKRALKPVKVPDFAMPADDVLKTTASGLKYEVIKEGTGTSPQMGQRVTVHYAGWLTDGKLFDASYTRRQTSSFVLGRVIPGWNEGLQLMKEGGIYKFVIPGSLGYGPAGNAPDIPPNATLVFQVELIKVGS